MERIVTSIERIALKDAKREGKIEGKREGKKEGKIEAMREMVAGLLEKGVNIDIIRESIKLPKKELDQLFASAH